MISKPENPTEDRRKLVQELLDSQKSLAQRNRLGQFATPNDLAIEIARYIQSILPSDFQKIRFADPAIGTGSFFSALLTVFGENRIESAMGFEIDRDFNDAAHQLWSEVGLEVIEGDFTRSIENFSEMIAPNLIFANPPYVRHHHLSPEEKIRLQKLTFLKTGIRVNGLAGLYVHFLLLATSWMEEGGYAAWLIPAELMDVIYGIALKRYLLDQVTLIRIHRFDPNNLQFGDALVSSAVLVFRKIPPGKHPIEFTMSGTISEPHIKELVSVEELRKAHKWSGFPRNIKNDRYSKILSCDPNELTLGDFFQIKRGIATGCNEFFILDRQRASELRIPDRYLRPILPSPRDVKLTVIETDSDGYPLITPQLVLIDCDLPEAVLQEKYPDFWKYLQTAHDQGIRDGYLIKKRKPWYRQEHRKAPLFLCTYMGRGNDLKNPFRFIWNRSQAIASNLYLMLYPKNELAELLASHPEYESELFILLQEVTGHELRSNGRVYGGGLHKIEPDELARISASNLLSRWPELKSMVQHPMGLFG